MILRLTRELGVNLAGVEVILSMREKMEQMQREMEESIYQLRSELTREMRRREEMRTALVPVRRVKVTKLD
jgi:MerR family transcriptional regulator/heat shock protein HspR